MTTWYRPSGLCHRPPRKLQQFRPLTAHNSTTMADLYSSARSHFPYFAAEHPAFMENAGGSQVPQSVIDSVAEYMAHSYAQLGAGHEVSNRADATVALAHGLLSTWMNAEGVGEVVLGPSTSQLLANLGDCYGRVLAPGDEVIVHQACHEANAGPWVRAAQRSGAMVKWWHVDPATFESPLASLAALVTPRTRLIAVTHVSNILGEVLDVAALVRLVKQELGCPDAHIIVDGVAYAPHLAIDVRAWGCDWYAFSTYKTFGPHMAALYGSHAAFAALGERGAGPNHFWIPAEDRVYKFELGGVSHEGCAGLLGTGQYLQVLAEAAAQAATDGEADGAAQAKNAQVTRQEIEDAFRVIAEMEKPHIERVLACLASKPDVTVVGPKTVKNRVATFSFVHRTLESQSIAATLQSRGFAVRHGHMYAYRLLEALQLRNEADVEEGVVRISLLHYNSPSEVDRLIVALEEGL